MYRIGIGYDIHKLIEGRDLVIGGVKITHEKGLLGHSDADVLIHAIIDAMLGALALSDIGTLFPDNDELYKDADSTGQNPVALLERLSYEKLEALAEDAEMLAKINAVYSKFKAYVDEKPNPERPSVAYFCMEYGHNDANVLVMPGRYMDTDTASKVMEEFFNTAFEGGRHQKRIDKIPVK